MSTYRNSLTAFVTRGLGCVTIVAIVIAIAWGLHPGWFRWMQNFNESPARGRSPDQLLAAIDTRLASDQERISSIEESLQQMRTLHESLKGQAELLEADVESRHTELENYASLVNADEGIILVSGEYVSETAVRERALERRSQYTQLRNQLDRHLDLVRNVHDSLTVGEAEVKSIMAEVEDLQALRSGLVEKMRLLASLEAVTHKERDSNSTLIALRSSVERMQDVIDVRLELINDDMNSKVSFDLSD